MVGFAKSRGVLIVMGSSLVGESIVDAIEAVLMLMMMMMEILEQIPSTLYIGPSWVKNFFSLKASSFLTIAT